MWRNKQHLPEGGKGTDVRIIHKSLYQFWVRLFSQVSCYRAGDHSVVTPASSSTSSSSRSMCSSSVSVVRMVVASLISILESNVVISMSSSWSALLTIRRRMFSSPVASFSCWNARQIITDRLINSKAVSRSMIIAHFIYYSGQSWLEHAKDFYLEMSGPPARSWPGVTRVGTGGRASRLSLKRAVTCDGR